MAAMRGGDRATNRQAQAGTADRALAPATVELVEHPLLVAAADARPVVGNADEEGVAGRSRPHLDR